MAFLRGHWLCPIELGLLLCLVELLPVLIVFRLYSYLNGFPEGHQLQSTHLGLLLGLVGTTSGHRLGGCWHNAAKQHGIL
eukprot:scaffold12869_cov22-Tisochrysis_lutea.AAC.1